MRLRPRLPIIAIMLISACVPGAPQDSLRITVPPPTPISWVASAAPITLENVARVQTLGRLDQPGGTGTVIDYAISPDSTRLAALTNTQITVWDLVAGTVVFNTGRSDSERLYFSPDKTELYGVGGTGEVIVLDAINGAVKTAFQSSNAYNGVAAFDRDSGWLVLGGSDGSVKVWDTLARTSLATLQAHTSDVIALAFSADGERLATAGRDAAVRLWEWRTQTRLFDWPTEDVLPVRLAYSPDDAAVAAGLPEGARVWSAQAGTSLYDFALTPFGASEVLTFAPDGRYLLGGNSRAGLMAWSMADGSSAALPDFSGAGLIARYAPEGGILLTSAFQTQPALWNVSQMTGQTLNRANLSVSTNPIIDIGWTDDNRLMLFLDARGPIYIWGIAEGG
jgi:WD40 repeat protein